MLFYAQFSPPNTTRRSCSLTMTFGHDDSTVNAVVVIMCPVIVESSLWKSDDAAGRRRDGCRGRDPGSRDSRPPAAPPSVPLGRPSSQSSTLSSSWTCECLSAAATTGQLHTPPPSLASSSSSSSSVECMSASETASTSASLFAVEPTNILPFLFLGSQRDALSSDVIAVSSLRCFMTPAVRRTGAGIKRFRDPSVCLSQPRL